MATGSLVALAVVSAASSIYSGSVQAAAASDQAKQAKIAGESSLLSSRQKAANLSKQKTVLKAKQIAQAAGAGLDVGSGSLIDIQRTTDKQAAEDISNVLSAGRMSLATGQATASSLQNQSSGFMTSGFLGAGESLMGGAMSVGKVQGWEGFENF